MTAEPFLNAMDDLYGNAPRQGGSAGPLVRSMPGVFRVISIIGTIAMLWVGGHLVLANLGEVGWHAPVDLLHAVEHALEPAGAVVVWLADTAISAVAGLAWGLVIVGVVLLIGKAFGRNLSFSEGHAAPKA